MSTEETDFQRLSVISLNSLAQSSSGASYWSKISGCLNETIWSNRHLRNETKVRISKSVIGPVLTCEAKGEPIRQKYTNIGSNRNENIENNYKQNKDRQNEK